MSIRTRLLLLVLVFTLPLVGAMLWYAHAAYEAELSKASDHLRTLAVLAAEDLDKGADGGVQLLSGLAHAPELRSPDKQLCSSILARQIKNFPQYTGILTFDLEGNLVCDALDTKRKQNFSQREYFRRAQSSGQTVVGDPVFGKLTGKAVLPILHPLRDPEGKVYGYLYASYDLQRFAEELHDSLDAAAVFAVWGKDATLMARYPPLPAWAGKSARDLPFAKHLQPGGQQAALEHVGIDGTKRIWAAASLRKHHGSDTWISVALPKDQIVAKAMDAMTPLLASILAGVFVALVAAVMFVEVVIRQPVARLANVVQRFAAGDRSARMGAPYPRGELGDLMRLGDTIAAQAETEHQEVEFLTAQLESRVSQRTAELQAANHELEEFCHSLAHDLRAPLRHVQGFSEILMKDHAARLDRDGEHCIERIQNATIRMGSLIDDLLHLSRVTRAGLHYTDLDLSAMASGVLTNLAQRDPGREVAWQVQPGIRVSADAELLNIALQHLLSNAWKFTSLTAQAHIGVSAETRNGEVICQVRDNGAGFDMTYADKLFHPFQRLHPAHEFPGTGIGLVTVHRIITRLGGRVWMEGAPGAGATVHFTFPEAGHASQAHSAG